MNLNELVINHGRGRGKKNYRGKVFGLNKISPPVRAPTTKKTSSPSSELNWGKNHTSVPITPSTIQKSVGSSRISSEDESKIIIALTEGRGEARCEVGMAVINVSKPLLILCQISDTQSYINTLTKINIFNPNEILIPATFIEKFSGNRLIDKVKEQFRGIKYTGVARSIFNKAAGKDILSELCIPDLNAILLALQHRYYALAAAAALITYIQENLFIYYAHGSVKIDYQESEGFAIIDVSTADRLELVCSTKPAQSNKYSSLFGVLNHCQTKIGTRTLRSAILQPLCDIEYIEERLSCVTELTKHPEALLSIQALLQKVPNIDLLLGIATIIPDDPQRCSNRQLNYILLLNSLLDLISPLKDILSKLTQPFYKRVANVLESEEFITIRNIVRNTIQDGAHPAKGQAGIMQRCFAINPGINGLLDLVRKTYSERIDDMREYVKKLAEKYDLALTLGNNQSKGHHIVLSLNQQQKRYMKKSDLPDEFIHVNRLVGSFTMKTPELINLSTRLDGIMRDVLTVSNVMVHSIIMEIKKYVGLFYKLCEEIALLDVVQSLAETSIRNGYVRPKFGEFTEITFAHHPLLDFLLSTKPISNHIECSTDYNLHVITGPNGSGKSIFIRQVVLLQIMAQIGCYVPAQTAIFRPADRMFARICLQDNMEYGASSFMLEMKEIKYIVTTMTENSLIIIDELCRSTSLEEGTALAIAILEKLAESSAFVYVTTHYTLLTNLHDIYLNVKAWHMETIPSGEDPRTFKLDFRYNLIPGINSVKHYGVYIVRNIWSDTIFEYVCKLLEKISKTHQNPNFLPIDEKVRLKYSVESTFRKLKSQKKLTIAEINKILNQYQNDMHKLGYPINSIDVAPNMDSFQESIPEIRHSVFDYSQNFGAYNQNSTEEDLQSVDERMRQIFTPALSLTSQMDIEMQKIEENMKEIFTPEETRHFDNVYGSQDDASNEDSLSQSSRYRNISNFIGQNSKNINMLVPEIHLSYEGTSTLSQTSSNFAQNKDHVQNMVQPKQNHHIPRPASSVNLSDDMDQFRFSEPLCKDFSKTSTPVIHQKPFSKSSSSPLVHICSQKRNFSTSSSSTPCPSLVKHWRSENSKTLDEIDLESIREELEVCSKILDEDDDDFENSVLSSLPDSKKSDTDKAMEPTYQHLMPKVTIIQGPNNTTSSFDENDVKEPDSIASNKKINIISNVLISPKHRRGLNEQNTVCGNAQDLEVKQNPQIETCKTEELPKDHEIENEGETYKTWSKIYNERVPKYPQEQMKNDSSTGNIGNSVTDNNCTENEEKNNSSEPLNGNSEIESAESNIAEAYNVLDGNTGNEHLFVDGSTKLEENGRQFKSCGTKFIENENGVDFPLIDRDLQVYKGDLHEDIATLNDEYTPKDNKSKQCENLDSSGNVDKTAITSISNASKLRNLEEITDSDSDPQGCSAKKTSDDKTTTSTSSVSRKRNLDQQITESSPSGETKNSTSKTTDKSDTTNSLTKQRSEEGGKNTRRGKKLLNRAKFVPPRKLSAKEILDDFKEQDRKILEGTVSSPDFSKYLAQLIKRPSVKQLRNATHVAYSTKTDEGVEVSPAQLAKRRRKKSPIKRRFSNENINMSMFSDKNALPFEQYLNSAEKDYKAFSFNIKKGQKNIAKPHAKKFDFEPTVGNLGEYTNKSVITRLVRNNSDVKCSQSNVKMALVRQSSEMSQKLGTYVTQQSGQTLTPDGFYKQNKEDIHRILDKYMMGGGPVGLRDAGSSTSRNNVKQRSMFENDDISAIDLDI